MGEAWRVCQFQIGNLQRPLGLAADLFTDLVRGIRIGLRMRRRVGGVDGVDGVAQETVEGRVLDELFVEVHIL